MVHDHSSINFNFLRDRLLAVGVYHSYPQMISKMRSLQHVSEALMLLDISTIRRSSNRIEISCVWYVIVVISQFLFQVSDCSLLCELLPVQRD
jgi:hypothetical protein